MPKGTSGEPRPPGPDHTPRSFRKRLLMGIMSLALSDSGTKRFTVARMEARLPTMPQGSSATWMPFRATSAASSAPAHLGKAIFCVGASALTSTGSWMLKEVVIV